MRMQAAILAQPNTPFRIESVSLDPPQAGEALIKIAASGVCRSDWRVAIGTAPIPLSLWISTGRKWRSRASLARRTLFCPMSRP